MKSLIIFIAIFAISYSIPTIPELERYIAEGFEPQDHKFGALHLTKETPEGTEQVIVWPKHGFFSEPEHFDAYHKMLLQRQSNPINISTAIEECQESPKPDYFKFAPTFIGYVVPGNAPLNYSAPCFAENSISATIIDDETILLTYENSNASSFLCADAYFYATTQNFHLGLNVFGGQHNITFRHLSQSQFLEFSTQGIAVFRFCDHLYNDLPDVFMSLELFLGGFGTNPNIPFFGSKPTDYMVKNNVEFIYDATGYQWEERPEEAQKTVYNIDPSLVKSGDFFAITRLDGLDQIIEYGAGSHCGHSTVAMWIDNELYILESQAAWYWPRKNIQMNLFSVWMEWANNAGFHVTWLPLKEEYRQMFNNETAWEWFQTVNNTPYGYHNFIFGWVDTTNESFPPLLSVELVAPAFSIVEKISPYAASEVFTLALNKRINSNFSTIPEIANYLVQNNLTFPELYAIPEQDSWVYPDGVSLVCSSFVIALWKNAGLFGNLTIEATEFTPRDIYQLEYIDPNPQIPSDCQALDPQNPYCQVMGKYRMQFPGISTVDAYTHMNEHCPSTPPLYLRTEGCQEIFINIIDQRFMQRSKNSFRFIAVVMCEFNLYLTEYINK